MPAVRNPVRFKQFHLKPILGIVYAQNAPRATPVQVPTILHPTNDGKDNPRFPSFEAILGAGIQMHECWVTCQDSAGHEHQFLIAAQYSLNSEVNAGLKDVLPEAEWRGGLVVMRGGHHVFVVGMGGARYKSLAEQAVRKFLLETAPVVNQFIHHNADFVIPTQL